MINIYNKRLAFGKAPEPGLLDGILPFAPVNRLAMLRDYIDPAERAVACPNQDVAYGGGPLALDVSPVVVQVPDFGNRFWVYQIVDLRTDSFASLGKMYGTTSGFYLLVGPNWRGDIPKGITRVFRSTTNTGFAAPRVFVDDTPEDKQAAQAAISGIDTSSTGRRSVTIGVNCRNSQRQARAGVKPNGWSPRRSLTNCLSSWPTRRRCPAKKRTTPKCWPSSRRRKTTPRSKRR
jgi:hypothetical protein